MSAYRSLARAMLRGFLRDRGSLIFTVALPVLFLVLLGSIYKGTSTPQVKVTEIGRVPLLDQAVRSAQLRAVLKVSHAASQASALQKVRQGDVDAAVSQQGSRLILHYSIADQVTSGVVRALFSSLVQAANQAGHREAARVHAGHRAGRGHLAEADPVPGPRPARPGRSPPAPPSARRSRWSAGGRRSCCGGCG